MTFWLRYPYYIIVIINLKGIEIRERQRDREKEREREIFSHYFIITQ